MYEIINMAELEKLLASKGLQGDSDEILHTLEKNLNSTLKERVKIKKNKQRIVDNDLKKERVSAVSTLSSEQVAGLPSWVKEDIDNAVIVGKSKKVIQISDGRKYHLDNRLNHLSGGEWTFGLTSVINTRYPTSGVDGYAHNIRKIHPSPKPPQLMGDIVKFFTKPNEYILDYFMGVGGTLLGASLHGRKAVGIDLEPKYISAYKEASIELSLPIQDTLSGNSLEYLKNQKEILELTGGDKFSLILIDPPYGDMMARAKTGEAVKKGKSTEATPFTNLETDLGNLDWLSFRDKFKESVDLAGRMLKDKGHIVVFIKDFQPKIGSPNLLHADLVNDISSLDCFEYQGMRIWADQCVNLYPYGYPYSFVANQIHQYILVFRKGEF